MADRSGMNHRRIVVTGIGAVTPLGTGVETFWNRLVEGRSGISRITRFPVDDLACRIAGQVGFRPDDADGFDAASYLSRREQRRMDTFIHFAFGAAEEALQQSGWTPTDEEALQRTGTVIATGVGGFPAMLNSAETVRVKGPRRISPFSVPSYLANLAAGQISIRYGFRGPIGTPVTACAASTQAIGDAARLIRCGEADIVLAGGAEACIDRVSYAGFAAAKALSTGYNDTPERASRPFDKQRDGFVMGEGAAMLVLESRDHALARGAEPIAELVGYGTSADAYHVTALRPDGGGGAQAMAAALRQAGLAVEDVGYINAHSTSTSVGDAGEIVAIRKVFGDVARALHISATKSSVGHLQGAAGAIEAIASIKALVTGILPPTLNLYEPDDDMADLNLIPHKAIDRTVRYVLSNSFGFGGVNASVIFAHP